VFDDVASIIHQSLVGGAPLYHAVVHRVLVLRRRARSPARRAQRGGRPHQPRGARLQGRAWQTLLELSFDSIRNISSPSLLIKWQPMTWRVLYARPYIQSDTDTLSLLLVDGRVLRFACFAGGAYPRDLALEALRACAAARHPQAPFLALLAGYPLVHLSAQHVPFLSLKSTEVH